MAAEVALGHAGLVLGLEVSRLARNNVDWYRLLDLCGVTDTVIGDADGLYHPGSFNDRLLLGLEGHDERGRAARAPRPAGGRDPQQGRARRAAQGAAGRAGVGRGGGRDPARSRRGGARRDRRRSSTGSPSSGSVRQVWLWMRREGVQFPMRRFAHGEIQWIDPDLPSDPQRAREPRLCRRVRVRQDPPRALRRRARQHAPADASPPPSRMGRLDLGSPPRLHRQGHVREQPRADRRATPARARTSPAARSAKAARCCKGSRSAAAADASSRSHYQGRRGHKSPAYHCPGQHPGREPRQLVHAGRRRCRSTRPSPARCSPRSPPPA